MLSGTYGIVTAISDNIWDDYLLFHMSLMRTNGFQLLVVDLGLNNNQKNFIRGQQNTTLIELPDGLIDEIKTIDQDWRKWYKPVFFKHAKIGLDFAIWLDADLIVATKLDEMFKKAQERFFVVQDYFAPQYCHNKSQLYDHYAVEQPTNRNVVNSGVLGGSFPRDDVVVDRWVNNVEDAHREKSVYDGITLHDQGALLLAIHQLGIADSVLNIKCWNYPARRLFYDTHTDIVDAVINDHPGVSIIHYAGAPKLPHLQTINHTKSQYHFKHRYGEFVTNRMFVTGADHLLESTIKTMRFNIKLGGLFRFFEPPICADYMRSKLAGKSIALQQNVISDFSRIDCPYLCIASPYFGAFFDDLSKVWPGAIYAVLLDDPLLTIKHKLNSYKVCCDYLSDAPGDYQSDCWAAMRSNHRLDYLNRNRTSTSGGLVKACVDEFMWCLAGALETANRMPNRLIVWANSPSMAAERLTRMAERVFDRAWYVPKTPIVANGWVDDVVDENMSYITDSFYSILAKFKVSMPRLIP